MPVSRLKFESLPHAIFLQRVSGPESATTLEARLGQGAFLALRLVDLLAPDRGPVSQDAFHYQWVATDRFCRELVAAATEGAHVHGIAESASDAYRLGDIRLVSPALFAYAHFLETELRLEEALDVLMTLLLVLGNRLSSTDAVAGQLRFARVHRKLNRFDEAIPHAWQAFQLYEEEDSRFRALGDVGIMLLSLGDATGAERALAEVFRRGRTRESVSNAVIELMHCASYRRDHVGFARWRERCEDRLADMPPNIRADFYLKQGIGQARFARYRRAEVLMKEALAIVGAAGLHEFEFRIERILAGLADCHRAIAREMQPAREPVVQTAELREGSESLAQLRG